MKLLRPDAVDRTDRPTKYVVCAFKLASALERYDVQWFFDDCDKFFVTTWIAVQFRYIFVDVNKRKRHRAVFDARVEFGD
jgi:hypothetical protein